MKNLTLDAKIGIIAGLLWFIPMLMVLCWGAGFQGVYETFKDHGSLIAGILGFGGIFILVWNQNKSTKKTTDATLRAIRLESFEIKRREYLEDLVDIYSLIDSAMLTPEGISMGVITSIRVKTHRLVLFRNKAVEGRIFLLETYFVFLDALDYLVVNPNKILRQKSDFLTIEKLRADLLNALELTKHELDTQLAWSEHRKWSLDKLTQAFKRDIKLIKRVEARDAGAGDTIEFYEGVSKEYKQEVSMVIVFLNPLLRSAIDHISSLKAEDNA